jgi:hypothetical protein
MASLAIFAILLLVVPACYGFLPGTEFAKFTKLRTSPTISYRASPICFKGTIKLDMAVSDSRTSTPTAGLRTRAKKMLVSLVTIISALQISPRMSNAASVAQQPQQQASKAADSDITVKSCH